MIFSDYSKTTLLPLSKHQSDGWTIDDAMKGVSIMGGTGSGKTTASGRALARKYLKEGWGGVVLCAKTDEADLWRQYCEETGRSDDLIIFGKGSSFVFNPIDYEMKRPGNGAGETQNITNIFMNIYRMGNRIASEGDTKEERFWDTALKRTLNRIIDLIKISGEDLTYRNMVRILSTSDKVDLEAVADGAIDYIKGNLEELNKDANFCLRCLVNAFIHVRNEDAASENNNAYQLVFDYFTNALQSMGKRTKAIITESFMGLAEPFLSGLLYRHFAGATNIFPEQTYGYHPKEPTDTRKRIIVLDFSIKEYLDAGIIGQCVFKLMFQQAIERRNVEKYSVPVFLWCDEAQYFVSPYDQIFLTTARSSRTSTVFLSQNISNYFAVMGSGNDAKARVDSLMGNLSTKIFHANSDAETNEYASRLIGNDIGYLANVGNQQGYVDFSYSNSEGLSSQYLPQVQPREFTTLKSGGEVNNYKVEAVIMVSGRKWSDEKNFIKTTFVQKFQNHEK